MILLRYSNTAIESKKEMLLSKTAVTKALTSPEMRAQHLFMEEKAKLVGFSPGSTIGMSRGVAVGVARRCLRHQAVSRPVLAVWAL
jgi:hypothetical protein